MSRFADTQARDLGPLRRWLVIDPVEATFAKRGFFGSPEKREHLESIGAHFIDGYNAAIACREPEVIFEAAQSDSPSLRGFVVEGASMAVALCDGLTLGRRRLPRFLSGAKREFRYLAHVGVGWAMARVPWYREVLRSRLDQDIAPLAYDGWGFHDTYFNIGRVLKRAGTHRTQAPAAYYQGVGRGLWFASGAAPQALLALLEQFPSMRRPDLWSGIGLAASYAGGATEVDLRQLDELSGPSRPWLHQGAAFAAEARTLANWVPPHTELACQTWTDTSAGSCAREVQRTQAENVRRGSAGEYEEWRAATARHFAAAQKEPTR